MALGDLLQVAGGVTALAVAVTLLALASSYRAARVFALYLVLVGIGDILRYGVRGLSADPAVPLAANATFVYFFLPQVPLLLYFAALYPHPRGWLGRSPWAPGVVLAVSLGTSLAYLLHHGLWLRGAGTPWVDEGPLFLVFRLWEPLAVTTIALVLVRDALRDLRAPYAGTLLLVAAALTLEPAYNGSRLLFYSATGIIRTWSPAFVTWPMAALPALVSLALVARHARRAPYPAERTLARRAVLLLALGPAVALGVTAVSLLTREPGQVDLTAAGAIAVAVSLLVAYGLLRRRLFDVDVRAKRLLRKGTLVAAFAGIFLAVREGAGVVVPGEGAVLLGMGAAAGLALGFARVQGLADRLADRLLPGAEDEVQLNARKIEVYRAALEEAFVEDGDLPAREATRLAALRRELGLTERDHALLAFAVRSARTPWRPRPVELGALLLGRYRVERLLGEGANGVTYLARDEASGREPVAVKVLRPERGADPDSLREAKAMQAVRHPSVVAMREVADAQGLAVIVMEYLEGGSLAARLASGPLAPAEFRPVADGLLAALGAVHARGVVHRDVKPSNVLLTGAGEAKLADFGVAHLPGFETTVGGGDMASAIGTVRFMSPEQARGRRVTERSDLFSAAATLYEAWTGKPYLAPLPGESAVELQMRAAAGQAFPGGFEGPEGLRAWFVRGLHAQPERRFASAEEMLGALRAALPPAGPEARRH